MKRKLYISDELLKSYDADYFIGDTADDWARYAESYHKGFWV